MVKDRAGPCGWVELGISLYLWLGCKSCVCVWGRERLRTIAVVFYLFLAVWCCHLSVFLASNCDRCLGRWKRMIWGWELLTQVVLDTVQATAPPFCLLITCWSTTARFETTSTRTSLHGGSSCLNTHLNLFCTASSGAVATAECQICTSVEWLHVHHNRCTGSVDLLLHAKCCMRRPSQCMDAKRLNVLILHPVRERQRFWTVRKMREMPLLSIETPRPPGTTHSCKDNIKLMNVHLKSVALRILVELGRSCCRPGGVCCKPVESPNSVNGGKKVALYFLLSSSRFFIMIFEKRCPLLCFQMWLQLTASGVIFIANWFSRDLLFEPLPSHNREGLHPPIETVKV